MGIARFYRWLSERYPLVNEVIEVDNVPDFDNLYLDMNGIIHHCSHGNTGGRKQASEDHMWLDVFKYISGLVYRTKPKKLLYLAVDGVAPRAKMNQQRSRRFRAAHDAKESRERSAKMRESTVEADSGSSFDSNCITPGTEFMERLVYHLEFFVKKKIAEDPLWKGLKVVVSGPDVPGEGEHKIMDFIRSEKSQPDYNPNTRHCLYGLDADLIMLSLASHEPFFALLREEIDFGFSRTKSKENRSMVKADKFQLLHIGVLREYLALDFLGEEFLKKKETAESLSALDRVIDDFVMFCFLVGNDFLPHLPFSEIGEGGLNKLFNCYKELRRKKEGRFLATPEGKIDYANLFAFLEEYIAVEYGLVDELLMNDKWKIGQTRRCDSKIQIAPNLSDRDEWEAVPVAAPRRVALKTPESVQLAMDQYYEVKLGITNRNDASHLSKKDLVVSYLQGLQWVYSYYFKGPPSWDWYYPFHYSPFAADIVSILGMHFDQGRSLSIEFVQGQPFRPFEQLMAVLPPASGKNLLPQVLYKLMVNPGSPIRDCYPEAFEIDVDGVKVPWGGVTIIPFVDEKKLLKAISDTLATSGCLTKNEAKRNTLGEAKLFCSYDATSKKTGKNVITGAVSSIPTLLKDVSLCSITEEPFVHRPLPQGMAIFPHHVLKGYSAHAHADFPSLLKHSEKFEIDFSFGSGVRIFNSMSKQESLFLSLSVKAESTIKPVMKPDAALAINFPFYSKRFSVLAVSDSVSRTKLVKGRSVTEPSDLRKHEGNVHWLLNKLEETGLIVDVAPDHPVVELAAGANETVKALYCMTMVAEKKNIVRAKKEGTYPSKNRTLVSLNEKNEVIFGHPYTVEGSKAVFTALPSLDFLHCMQAGLFDIVKLAKHATWLSAAEIGRRINFTEDEVWALFGEVWIRHGKFQEEVGMNLWSYTSTGEPQCVAGFSKFVPSNRMKAARGRYSWNRWDQPDRTEWTFSCEALESLEKFNRDCPELISEVRDAVANANLSVINNGITLQGKLLFSRFQKPRSVCREDWVNDFLLSKLVSYVNASAWRSLSICNWAYESLSPKCVDLIVKFTRDFTPSASVDVKVDLKTATVDSFNATPQHILGQRGVYVKQAGLVPVGTWATVLAIYGSNDVRIDLLLDAENMNASSLNGTCPEMRGLRVLPADFRAAHTAPSDVQDKELKARKNKILADLIVHSQERKNPSEVKGIKINVSDLFGPAKSEKRRPLPPTALFALPAELTSAQPAPTVPEFLLSKLRHTPPR